MPAHAPHAFASAEYDRGHGGLEVKDAGSGDAGATASVWRGATVYTHRAGGNLVLWFGGNEYEGIGGSYRWCSGGRRTEGTPRGPRLLDSDGDAIPTRAAPHQSGKGMPTAADSSSSSTGAAGLAGRPKGRAGQFLPFNRALLLARSLGLASEPEWRVWCRAGRRPPELPADPRHVYKDSGWQGWGHWLGTGNAVCNKKEFLPFDEALALARSLQLRGQAEWEAWVRGGFRPANVPSKPDAVYKHAGWQRWGHWLGTGNGAGNKKAFLPFGEALAVARSTGLSSQREWYVWSKGGLRPPNVPSAPSKTYMGVGWQGWGHWLGSGNGRSGRGRVANTAAIAAAATASAAATDQRVTSRKRAASGQAPRGPPCKQQRSHD